jgi:steroid 5-alpha reductase family enzyme
MVFLGAAGITACIQLAGFAAASALKTEVFYDVLGGLNFMALAAHATGGWGGWEKMTPRSAAITGTFIASRAWLLGFLAWRAHARGGDSRFDPILRPKNGGPVRYKRFLVFWIAQGIWVYCISAPMMFINAAAEGTAPPGLGLDALGGGGGLTLDAILFAGFAFGVAIEIIADVQKARWVANGRRGGFCTAGVWSLSRHPNYFGEMFQWMCCWLLAYGSSVDGLSDPAWWACAASPFFTFQILLNTPATGVAQANGKGLKRYYESDNAEAYKAYRASTSILIPMLGYQYVPLWLKRTVCLDLEKYEYRPRVGKKK